MLSPPLWSSKAGGGDLVLYVPCETPPFNSTHPIKGTSDNDIEQQCISESLDTLAFSTKSHAERPENDPAGISLKSIT